MHVIVVNVYKVFTHFETKVCVTFAVATVWAGEFLRKLGYGDLLPENWDSLYPKQRLDVLQKVDPYRFVIREDKIIESYLDARDMNVLSLPNTGTTTKSDSKEN